MASTVGGSLRVKRSARWGPAQAGKLYALTHPWALLGIEERFDGIVRAFREAQRAREVRPG